MNNYSITSDSRRWWWLPATAGAIGAAAITAILVVPATGTAPSYEPATNQVGGVGDVGTNTVVERPCYLARRDWNTVRGWEQPVCTTRVGGAADDEVPHVRRAAEDYRP